MRFILGEAVEFWPLAKLTRAGKYRHCECDECHLVNLFDGAQNVARVTADFPTRDPCDDARSNCGKDSRKQKDNGAQNEKP